MFGTETKQFHINLVRLEHLQWLYLCFSFEVGHGGDNVRSNRWAVIGLPAQFLLRLPLLLELVVFVRLPQAVATVN